MWNSCSLHSGGILEFRDEIDERLSQRWHNVGGVVLRQPSDDTDCKFSIVEDFVVQSDEQASNVFRLS